jgi:hypothetical protein
MQQYYDPSTKQTYYMPTYTPQQIQQQVYDKMYKPVNNIPIDRSGPSGSMQWFYTPKK